MPSKIELNNSKEILYEKTSIITKRW